MEGTAFAGHKLPIASYTAADRPTRLSVRAAQAIYLNSGGPSLNSAEVATLSSLTCPQDIPKDRRTRGTKSRCLNSCETWS